MIPVLQASLEQIETKKSEIVRMAILRSESASTESSIGNQWSAAQVVEHLVKFEELLLAGHKNVLASEKQLNPGLKGRVFVGLTGFMIRAKSRFGTTPELEPTGKIDLDQRLKDWNDIRETLTLYMDKILVSNLGATYTIHPIAGPLDAESTIRLISLHCDYHIRFFPSV